MNFLRYFNFVLFFISVPIFSYAQFENHNQVQAVLELNKQEDIITITGKGINNDNIIHSELNYLLLSLKQNPQGNLSNNKQEGKFVIDVDEIKILSQIQTNISAGDQIKIYLFIRDESENKLLSKDSLIFSVRDDMTIDIVNKPVQQKGDPKPDSFMLKGLAIDETKTKVGQDFFDLFFSEYNLISSNYAFILKVREQPSIGRSGIIHIEVGNEIIYSLHLMPNEDYLEEQVHYALRQINYYNRERAQLNTELEGI